MNSFPAPGVYRQTESCIRFHFRVFRYARFVAVASELTADNLLCTERLNRFKDLDFFVADRFAIGSNRRFHREVRQDLEHVVLHDIADCARLVVEDTTALDPEIFGHRDLHAFDTLAVPEWIEE